MGTITRTATKLTLPSAQNNLWLVPFFLEAVGEYAFPKFAMGYPADSWKSEAAMLDLIQSANKTTKPGNPKRG